MNISNLIRNQLPSFISKDSEYSSFVEFLEAYYEWLSTEKGIYHESNNLLDYINIDNTLDEFINYFYNQFFPSIPKHISSDKRKLLRFAKEFFQSKGTEKSYKFLFKSLFDSGCEIFYTKDFLLKPSDGKWYNPISIKLKSDDYRFLNATPYFIIGETSKTFAKIEKVNIVNEKTEIFLSEIKLTFEPTEYIIVVNERKEPVYFDYDGNISEFGEILKSQIYNPISRVDINSKFRGQYYFTDNPIVVYGGLPENGKGANVVVGDVDQGYIISATVDSNSHVYGYTMNTAIYVTPDIKKKTDIDVYEIGNTDFIILDNIITNSLGTKNNYDLLLNVDVNTGYNTNPQTDYGFSKVPFANANTIMLEAFDTISIKTSNLISVIVNNGGGGFTRKPELKARAMYKTDAPLRLDYDPRYDFNENEPKKEFASLYSLGILGPIFIENGGTGYAINDEIKFIGEGFWAFAKVTNVNASGSITSVNYYTKDNIKAPLGGYGYSENKLPILEVNTEKTSFDAYIDPISLYLEVPVANQSFIAVGNFVKGDGIQEGTTIVEITSMGGIGGITNIKLSKSPTRAITTKISIHSATGAKLSVKGIMGGSAKLIPITEDIGTINTFKILDYGEDYISAPNVSLKVEDFLIRNINPNKPLQKGDVLFSPYYSSIVDSLTLITEIDSSNKDIYFIRTYNYTKSIYNSSTKKIITSKLGVKRGDEILYNRGTDYLEIVTDFVNEDNKSIYDEYLNIFGVNYDLNLEDDLIRYNSGVITYGDGKGKATAKYLKGLILGNGRYLNEDGQLSSHSVLQDKKYNDYSYILAVEENLIKYKQVIYDLLHPAGTNMINQTCIVSEPYISPSFVELGKFDPVKYKDLFGIISTTPYSITAHKNSEIIEFPDNKMYTGKKIGINKIQLTENLNRKINRNYKITSTPKQFIGTLIKNSNEITNIANTSHVKLGQYLSGRYIPDGTFVESIETNKIVMSNAATANVGSVTYSRPVIIDNNAIRETVIANNYIDVYEIPINTKIISINNKEIIISNEIIGDINSNNTYYFIGDDIDTIKITTEKLN